MYQQTILHTAVVEAWRLRAAKLVYQISAAASRMMLKPITAVDGVLYREVPLCLLHYSSVG